MFFIFRNCFVQKTKLLSACEIVIKKQNVVICIKLKLQTVKRFNLNNPR